MKRSLSLLILPALTGIILACASDPSSPTTTERPGRGAISIEIIPNPIVASRVSGDSYDFPFEVVIREIGGRRVSVTHVGAEVFAFGSIKIAEEAYDAAKIRSLGYATDIAALGELRYRFHPRRSVPDERLFSAVEAEVRVDAIDDGGAPVSARTSVTVRR